MDSPTSWYGYFLGEDADHDDSQEPDQMEQQNATLLHVNPKQVVLQVLPSLQTRQQSNSAALGGIQVAKLEQEARELTPAVQFMPEPQVPHKQVLEQSGDSHCSELSNESHKSELLEPDSEKEPQQTRNPTHEPPSTQHSDSDAIKFQPVACATLVKDMPKDAQEITPSQTRAVEACTGTRVAIVSAASGAIVLGATGGTTGLFAGGAIGAILGVAPAFVTFGLSIPFGAMMGGGTGLCLGTAAGSTAGFISGGALGYSAVYLRKHA